MASLVSPPRDPAAPLVYLPWGPAAPLVSSVCILVMSAAAPAPAPVCRVAEPLILRLIHLHLASLQDLHRQHRRCRSCQAHQSTERPTVSLPPANAHCRTLTGPSSLLSSSQPFSALSPCLGARACGAPPSYRAFSLPPPAPLLVSGSVSHSRRPPTGPSSLSSSPQPFLLPTPPPPLDSGSVSHLLRKTIPCGGRS